MAKRINPDGTTEKVELPAKVEAAKAEMKAEQSMGARRLAEAKARRGAKIERIEIEGEEWFVGRLDWPGINKVMLLTPRNERGEIDRSDRDTLRGLTAALLFCATFQSADDDALPFFDSFEQSFEYVREPEAAASVVGLYLSITNLNPLLDAKKKAVTSKE
jgi:hypothetical protein